MHGKDDFLSFQFLCYPNVLPDQKTNLVVGLLVGILSEQPSAALWPVQIATILRSLHKYSPHDFNLVLYIGM